MDRRAAPFKYRLAPLLKIDQWEGDILGIELRRARQVLEEKQRLYREILARIEQAEADMRALHTADAQIPFERRRLLSAYLHEQYATATTRAADASQAEKLFEQIMVQRQAKQQKIRALEQHQDRQEHQHRIAQDRAGLRDADDTWLITRR